MKTGYSSTRFPIEGSKSARDSHMHHRKATSLKVNDIEGGTGINVELPRLAEFQN